MKKIIFSLCLYLPVLSFGQAVIKEIRESNPYFKNTKYVFPLITVPGNKTASDRINTDLISLLEIDRKEIKKSIFENVWATNKKSTARLSDVSYAILHNDRKILSLSISAEGCGAYCEFFTLYYTFYLKTGEQIILDSLFNQQGVRVLSDSIIKSKRRQLETALKDITDSLNNPRTRSNIAEKEHYEGAKELYEGCLTDTDTINLEYLRFYLVKDNLYIIAGRCSAHMNRAYDEIGDFKFSFRFSKWKNYLTPYAKKLIGL